MESSRISRLKAAAKAEANGGDYAARTCHHPSHRIVNLFCSHTQATVVRQILKERLYGARAVVSPLRRIGNGWTFSMCDDCLVANDETATNNMA